MKAFALGVFTLLVAVSFASANDFSDNFKGIEGMYKEKSGGEMTIRKSDDAKMEAGPWRFVLKGAGDWACSEGVDAKGGDKPNRYYITFVEGPHKGQEYNIVRGQDGKVKELQLVGGSMAVWVKQ